MANLMSVEELKGLQGKSIYDENGEKIGKIEDFYYDDQTDEPEWIGVGAGMLGRKHKLVPLEGASRTEDGISVPYAKDLVKDTPDISEDRIEADQERELYEHYGMRYQARRARTQEMPQKGDSMPREEKSSGSKQAGGSVTRSEEEMRIGKREMEAGTARLRKWVETKPVEENVQLRRETAHIEREPINEPVQNANFGEEEVEVQLNREEPVVEKRTVAKERVSLGKESEEEQRTVQESLREERVEVEDNDDPRGTARQDNR